MNISRARLFVLSPIMLALAACGSSDNEPDNLPTIEKETTPINATVKGIAIDGYLGMAKACIDLNKNFQCDGDSEYQTFTNVQGEFTISAPLAHKEQGPLLITTAAGITTDSDHPNETISDSYFLLASTDQTGNTTVISPLTTLVYNKTQAQPTHLSSTQALANAEKEVLAQLKITDKSQLYSNFVAAASDTNLSEEQQKINQRTKMLAQVITDVMAKGLAASHNNATANNTPEVAKLFLDKFTNNAIGSVTEKIDNAIALGITDSAAIADSIIADQPSLIISSAEIAQGEVEIPLIISAPSNGVVDDNQNTFSWTAVANYNSPTDYQYSLDGGLNWQGVTDELMINVGNIDLAVAKVQVRVIKQDQQDAGQILRNSTAYFQQHDSAIAPTLITADDRRNHDSISWQLVSGFDNLEDYEMSLNGGLTWQDASSPIVIGNIDVAANQVQIRVKASVNQDAGAALIIEQAFNQYVAPNAAIAPTLISSDDINNTFTFALINEFQAIASYEIQINQGPWQTATNPVIQLLDQNYGIGSIKVRIKADSETLRPAGNVLSNHQIFTKTPLPASAPTHGVVDDNQNTFSWRAAAGFNSASDYQYSLDGGLNWQAVNGNLLINVTNIDIAIGQLQVRVIKDGQRLPGVILTNDTAYYQQHIAPAAPKLIKVDDQRDQDLVQWQLVSGFDQLGDYEISLDAGTTWGVATSPLIIGDIDLAADLIHIRVKESEHQDAGQQLIIKQAFNKYIIPDVPPAPTLATFDDEENTFTFSTVTDFDNVSDYEYTTDAGVNWRALTHASSLTINVGNHDIAIGDVGVRVIEDLNTGRAAGEILFNQQPYTKFYSLAGSPNSPRVDDTYGIDSLNWDYITDYESPDLYEYSIQRDIWLSVTSKPIVLGDVAIAANTIGIRVKAGSHNTSSRITYFYQALTTATTAMAPQVTVQDDANNIITFTPLDAYPAASLYQYRMTGTAWQLVSDFTIDLGDITIAIGDIEIRLAENLTATTPHPAGDIAVNDQAFTITPEQPLAPTALVIDDLNDSLNWTNVTNFEQIADYEYSIDGSEFTSVTTKPLSLGNINIASGQLQLRIKANTKNGRIAGLSANNTTPFTQLESALLSALTDSKTQRSTITTTLQGYQDLISEMSMVTGADLREKAKSASVLWHQDAVLIESATTIKQTLSDALDNAAPSESEENTQLVSDAITQLTNQLEILNTRVNSMPADIITAFNDASADAPVEQLIAIINQTRFAKVDWAGNLIESNTTPLQGWRCVLDTEAPSRTVWALLQDGNDNGKDQVNYSLANGDSAGDVKAQYNSQKICGSEVWALPNQAQLQTLTAKVVSGVIKLAQDRSVLPANSNDYSCLLDVNAKRAWIPFSKIGAAIKKGEISGKLSGLNNITNPCGLISWQLSGPEPWNNLDENSALFVGIDRNKSYYTKNIGYYPESVYYSTNGWPTGWVHSSNSYPGQKKHVRAAAILSAEQMPIGEQNIADLAVFPFHQAQQYWLSPLLDSDGNTTVQGLTYSVNASTVTVATLDDDSNTIAFARYVSVNAPAAPTNPVLDQTSRSLTWDKVATFDNLADYEYQIKLNGWHDVKNWSLPVGDNAIDVDDIQVRIKQTAVAPAGEILSNDTAIDETPIIVPPVAPTNPVIDQENRTFGWDNVTGFDQLSDYQYQINQNGWLDITNFSLALGDEAIAIGDLQVRVKMTSAAPAGLILSNDVAIQAVVVVSPVIEFGDKRYMVGQVKISRSDYNEICGNNRADLPYNKLTFATALGLDESKQYLYDDYHVLYFKPGGGYFDGWKVIDYGNNELQHYICEIK